MDYTPFQVPGIRYLKFAAVAGSNYQFRASGHWFRDFSVQLTASTAPVIIQQPQSCTVSPYNSTYFYVIAAGLPAPAYQWLFNSAPLPGESAPILIVRNIVTNVAGAYSVVVSNSGGTIQSTAATLTVTDTNPIPVLSALPPTNATQVPFILKGEPGRSYVFDATDDFDHWNECIYCFGWSGYAGDVSNSFTVPRINLQRQFIRASLDTRLDTCVAQLYGMRAALVLYAIDNKLMPADWGYTVENLAPYLPGATIPSCPQDGLYWPGAAVSNTVSCSWSYRGHSLPWDLRSFK